MKKIYLLFIILLLSNISYAAITGGGSATITNNVTSGGTSVDNCVPRFHGTDGLTLQTGYTTDATDCTTIDDSGNITVGGSVTATTFTSTGTGLSVIDQGLTINDAGGATANDLFTVEGDTDANLIKTDATNNRVGIGTASPATKLDVNGTITATGWSGIDLADMSDVNSATQGAGRLLVSDGNAFHSRAMTGDAVIDSLGNISLTSYDTKCIWFEDPTAADDFKSIWANKTANDFLLTEIWCESDQTIDFDLQVDDGSPADVNGTDIQCAAGENEDTSLGGDTTVAAGEELDLVVTSVANTPTWVSICFTGHWVQ